MSEADLPGDEEDGIPPGKRLVRAGAGAGLSLGERIAAKFYRLTWRTPLYGLRLRGRHPLKLLAVPENPVLGDAAAGESLLAGQVTFEGETLSLGNSDGSSGPDIGAATAAMARHYHSFVWLRDLAAIGQRSKAGPVAEASVRGWLADHGNTVSEPAWSAGVAGRRLLYWPSYAPLILATNDLVYRSSVLNSLARTARHVERAVEQTPPGLERLAAWCGIVAAGLLIAGGDARRLFGEAGLTKALGVQMSEDGGLVSRSPSEQLELVELLSTLRSVYAARKTGIPVPIVTALARSVPPLLGTVLGDGCLSSWQGGCGTSKSRIDAAIAASAERTRPLRQAREWGYQRLNGGQTVIVLDAAPPPHSRNTTHGCASTFAFEMSDGPNRLIVNCGGAAAAGIQSVAGLAQGLRTSAAHSTLVLADTNSTAVLANGSLGKGVDEVELDRQETDNGSRIEVSHDGYAKRFGFTHRRSLALAADGREARGEDTLLPVPNRRKANEAAFAVRFHLAPGVDPAPTADGLGALLRIEGGALWQFRCRGGALSIEPSLWVDGSGKWHATQQLVVAGEAASGGATIGWVIKRAG
jgi:uncharacterized heparinase superfamily protein